MSKLAFILFHTGLVLAGAVVYSPGVTAADLPADRKAVMREAVRVAPGTYRTGSREKDCHGIAVSQLDMFYIWPTETPQAWLDAFLGGTGSRGPDEPAAFVSHTEAEAFCRWFSKRYGIRARLPARQEWECAARAGKGGVTYSWGWSFSERPETGDKGMALFSTQPNPWGLHHMSGSVGEWCAADPQADAAPVMGGSWAERDPRFFRVSHRLEIAKDYRDADVGFRIVIDPAPEESVASASLPGE